MKNRVLILGGGYGGIFAGANLSIENRFDITIIDRNPYHELLQQIHYLVSRLKGSNEITLDLTTLFGNGQRGTSIFNAVVTSIALNERAVKVKRGEGGDEKLAYDYVIIALGKTSLGILSDLIVAGRMCDYTEDSIVDNFVAEIKNKEHGISVKTRTASKKIEMQRGGTQYPEAFDLPTYATLQSFLDLVP